MSQFVYMMTSKEVDCYKCNNLIPVCQVHCALSSDSYIICQVTLILQLNLYQWQFSKITILELTTE